MGAEREVGLHNTVNESKHDHSNMILLQLCYPFKPVYCMLPGVFVHVTHTIKLVLGQPFSGKEVRFQDQNEKNCLKKTNSKNDKKKRPREGSNFQPPD